MGLSMSPRRKQEPLDFTGILKEVSAELTKIATRPNLNSYRPHSKQITFHSAQNRGRLYVGGNRSGKTVGGIVEDLWWATRRHPYRKTPDPPVGGRIVGVDFDNGVYKILLPEVRRWIPPSELINGSWMDSWDGQLKTLTLANGSFLEFMSYSQELDAFAGTSRHFTHFDEEPPKAIWNECRMRLIDTGGSWWMTMTPVEGMTWVFDDIYDKREDVELKSKIDIIEVDIEENPYLSKPEIEEVVGLLDTEEYEARKEGKFVSRSGLILKAFKPEIHVIGEVIPDKDWHWCKSMDHGFNNPTAWLWHAVSPDGTVITFYEHYKREWTIAQHAARVHYIENEELSKITDRTVGDPSIRQRQATTGNSVQKEYALRGIPIGLANNDVKMRIDQMVSYLKHNKWFITENCRNLQWEMRRYKWKTHVSKKVQERHGRYDEPEKKDDHAIDSSGYHFVSMPQLPSVVTRKTPEEVRNYITGLVKPVEAFRADIGGIDYQLRRLKKPEGLEFEPPELPNSGLTGMGEWVVSEGDGYLGGIW